MEWIKIQRPPEDSVSFYFCLFVSERVKTLHIYGEREKEKAKTLGFTSLMPHTAPHAAASYQEQLLRKIPTRACVCVVYTYND